MLDFDIAYPFEVISFWMVEPEFFEKEFKVKYRLTNDQLKIKLDTDLLSVPLRKYERVRVRTIGLKFPKVDGYCKLEAIIVNEKGEEILQTPYWWIKLKPQFNE
ncbi:hypothetical protein [Leptospira licerasiae]|uniref:hypothetical protein n=1 Tax=Leptospira licerasiae TaxID=447106 RepID=UPI00301B6538